MNILFYVSMFFLSILLTYGVKIFAVKKAIVDIPNERSSHLSPTPRGGGIAILIVFYIGLFCFKEALDARLVYALMCAIPIAFISLVDDIFTLPSKIRFVVQSISALCALYFLDGINSIDFVFFELHGNWVNIIALVSILWLTNLYNFLDGIDGYASMQAITTGLGIYLFMGNPLGLVIVASNLGFLIFNWDKASIFMGDVGSATLGFIFAIFIFYDMKSANIYIWLCLLSLFWIDATLTIVLRFFNGEQILKAHRKHVYQRLVQSGWSHGKVVLFALGFNLIFLGLLSFINVMLVFMFNILTIAIIIYYVNQKKSFK